MRLGHMSNRGLEVLHNKGTLSGIKYCKLGFCKFCIMGRVAFSTYIVKDKGLAKSHTQECVGDLRQ